MMLSLSVVPTAEKLTFITDYLANDCHGVQDSTLRAAVAYALGETQRSSPSLVKIAALPFQEYLVAQGCHVNENLFYHAVAAAEIAAIVKDHQGLSTRGIGHDLLEDQRHTRGSSREYESDHSELLRLEGIKGFLAAIAFLSNIPRTKSIRNFSKSHWIKHIAEKYPCYYPNGEALGPVYVSNGSLIAAAIFLGFTFQVHKDEHGRSSRDVTFNMSFRSLNRIDLVLRGNSDRWAFDRNRCS